MQVRKPLRYSSESEPVFEDVKRHFGHRLPPEWEDVVYAACYPQLLDVTDRLFDQKLDSTGTIELYENPGFTNFRKCFAYEPDLAGEIWRYARQCCAKYDAGKKHETKAGLIRAILLRSWNAKLINENANYRHPTLQEAKQLRNGNPRRLKVKKVCELIDKEIADWITRDYNQKVTKADVEKARDSISKKLRRQTKK
jgi:hypothetical protein